MARLASSVASRRLADVPQDKLFWCQGDRRLRNLAELEVALREMADETFGYHANEAKNDFASWVRDVIGDDKLSRDLQKSRSRLEAAGSVSARISWLKSRL